GHVAAADLDDRAAHAGDVAGDHPVLRIDGQDRAAAEHELVVAGHRTFPASPASPASPGSSRPEKPSGISSASVHDRRSPSGLIAVTVTAAGSGANSSMICRHAPHGDDGGEASVHTASASSVRAPAIAPANTAVRSAHTDSPNDAFSTFAPSNTW